ncbi:hypothetical protein OG698_09800 [Streptomyces sp. NBC_01003]|uniref:hypothetical protein n=1 Tax=Streptomyces sp. NBC_01003 TaxID=2903714 RepID=UPI0038706140|nr:hypothetical protein OG698_09800 [Streptomyces sp. NBC_01003]
MDQIPVIVGMFAGGAGLAAWNLNRQQRKITSHLIDGRRIKVVCVLKDPQAPRWTYGHFVIESGAWSWEPRPRHKNPLMLPPDLEVARVREPALRETTRLNRRFLVMECTSTQGEVLVAALHGHAERVFMALRRP